MGRSLRYFAVLVAWLTLAGSCSVHDAEPPVTCPCGDYRTCEAGAIFGSACNICQCQPDGKAGCTAAACLDQQSYRCTADSDCSKAGAGHGTCAMDQGCVDPKGTCFTVFADGHGIPGFNVPQNYCGCDGATFSAAVPQKPYRHVGACP
jgi:hypothetical protein